MLERLLVGLAVGVLNWYAQRQDIRNVEQARAYRESAQLALAALAWKDAARDHPDGGAALRVQPDAPAIRLPGESPDAARPATGGGM